MARPEFAVSINIFTADPAQVASACEVLGRALAGLGLDGIDASMNINQLDEDEG